MTNERINTNADIARTIALPFARTDLIASYAAHDHDIDDLIDAMIDDLPDALDDDISDDDAAEIDRALADDRATIARMMRDLLIAILADTDPTTIELA